MRLESTPSPHSCCSRKTNVQAAPQSSGWFTPTPLLMSVSSHLFTWLVLVDLSMPSISSPLGSLPWSWSWIGASLCPACALFYVSSAYNIVIPYPCVHLPPRLWAFPDSDHILFPFNSPCLRQNKCTKNVYYSDTMVYAWEAQWKEHWTGLASRWPVG